MTLVRALLGRTPLGWRQLVHNKARFAMAVAGVMFAVLMMFMQLGFMNMLFDSAVLHQRQINADVVIINPAARDLINSRTFPRRRLIQAAGVDGVVDVEPLYVANVGWIKPTNGERSQIAILAARPDFRAFKPAEITERRAAVEPVGSALFDSGSRGDYRAFIERIEAGERPIVEVAGRRVAFEGTYRLGTTFGAEAMMIVSDQTFFALQPRANPATVSVGLVRVAPGRDPAEIARRIDALFDGTDAKGMTAQAFAAQTRAFMVRESPIAFVFSFGLVMAIVVGTVIVVQILASDVQDHLPEYATFKALGFSNGRLLSIVYEQSTVLTVLGFLPGFLAALGLYEVVRVALSMPIAMPADRVAMVFGLTAGMCALAGTLALRRVSRADPAEVF